MTKSEIKLNREPKELETEQEDARTVNREHARNGGRRKVKVKMRGVLKQAAPCRFWASNRRGA